MLYISPEEVLNRVSPDLSNIGKLAEKDPAETCVSHDKFEKFIEIQNNLIQSISLLHDQMAKQVEVVQSLQAQQNILAEKVSSLENLKFLSNQVDTLSENIKECINSIKQMDLVTERVNGLEISVANIEQYINVP